MTPSTDRHFLRMAHKHSDMSRDPSTRVGAIIVDPYGGVLGAGFNQFPRGIAYTAERLADRDTKNKLMVHAELSAILDAARMGIRLHGATLYLAATDSSGMVWGGPPCTRCTVEIIQAGIVEIVSCPIKQVPSRWIEDITFAGTLLAEAGIAYRDLSIFGDDDGR